MHFTWKSNQLTACFLVTSLAAFFKPTNSHGLGPESGNLKFDYTKPKVLPPFSILPQGLPHQVLIEIKSGGHLYTCGGSIISEDFVLSAASCFFRGGKFVSKKRIIVKAGLVNKAKMGENMQASYVWRIVMHKKFKAGQIDFDLALIQLEEPFELNLQYGVDSIRLAETGLDVQDEALISGWGSDVKKEKFQDFEDEDVTSQGVEFDDFDPGDDQDTDKEVYVSDLLKGSYVELIGNEKCQDYFDQNSAVIFLNERQRCSYSRSGGFQPAAEDLGGPLTCFTKNDDHEPVLCGLLSSQVSPNLTEGRLNVFINLQDDHLNRWIVRNIWLPLDENSFY